MANSINSQTSGTGGLISTASGTDGNLNIQSNGGTIGAFTASGLTVTGTVTATTLVGNGAAITNLPSATGLVPYTTFVNSTEKVTVAATAATGGIWLDGTDGHIGHQHHPDGQSGVGQFHRLDSRHQLRCKSSRLCCNVMINIINGILNQVRVLQKIFLGYLKCC